MGEGTVLMLIALGAVGGLVLIQAWLNLGASAPRGVPVPWISGPLGKLVRGDAVLFFYNPACVASRALHPHVRELAGAEERIQIVDVTEALSIAHAFSVTCTPTLVRIQDGLVRDTRVGMVPRRELEAMIRILIARR